MIGLLPDIDRNKFIRFGNGALAGAKDMLISKVKRMDAEKIVDIIHHVKPNEIEKEKFQYMISNRIYFK